MLFDVFKRFPDSFAPLLEYHDRVLRSDNQLTVGERELIAAYVSSLNACSFCYNAHEVFARAHGIAPDTIDALLDDPNSAAVEPKLRPLLAYVRKLTLTPAKVVKADSQAVYDAGWTEEALFAAIQTCALFNLMNRIVDGTGVAPTGESAEAQNAADLPRMDSYAAVAQSLGLK